LINIGRHFFMKSCWFVVGRNEKENKIIEKFKSCFKSKKGKPAVYYSKKNYREFAKELQETYRTGASGKERKKYGKMKL
jgi:hypothetical protein